MKFLDGLLFWFIPAFLAAVVGLLGYPIVDGLIRGVVVAFSRIGPSTAYSLVDQPKQYWLTLVGLAVVETLLIVLTVGTAWLARKINQ